MGQSNQPNKKQIAMKYMMEQQAIAQIKNRFQKLKGEKRYKQITLQNLAKLNPRPDESEIEIAINEFLVKQAQIDALVNLHKQKSIKLKELLQYQTLEEFITTNNLNHEKMKREIQTRASNNMIEEQTMAEMRKAVAANQAVNNQDYNRQVNNIRIKFNLD